MAGRIDPPGVIIVISVLGGAAVITDLWRRKIYNWMTIPAMIGGLAWMTIDHGFMGLMSSLGGMGTAILCFGFLMGLRWLGAGDVKLLMAFGAWGGAKYSLDVAVFSIILGGMLTLLVMIMTGRIFGFIRRMYRFTQSLLIRELELEPLQVDRKFRLPFAIPLVMAAISEALGNPLEKWDFVWMGGWHV